MPDKKSLLELLPDLIVKDFHLAINTEGTVRITEEKQEATCRWVEIKLKQSVPCFCFSIDKSRKIGEGDPIFPFFNPQKSGICSKNDAILICQKKQKLYILLIELKSKNPGDYLKQLKAAQTFVKFIFARIELYNMCKDKLINLEFRGILFSCRRTPNEGTTRHNKIVFNDRKGLLVTEQNCNQKYHLQAFLN